MVMVDEAPSVILEKGTIDVGDSDLPKVSTTKHGPQFVHIWDTVTGERSVTNTAVLPMQLKKRRKDGSLVFTDKDPKIKVSRGSFKCLLHPEGANRKYYDSLGFPTCSKANLTSLMQVELHMQSFHKLPWKTIERERVDKEKQEEKDFQRSLIKMAQGQAQQVKPKVTGTEERPLYVKGT